MFSYVVLIAAFSLACCAAWFSVIGIAQLFAGVGIAAGIMAATLELAKLVGVSFLYRYREQMPKPLRLYMWTGTVVLMLITSIGIYGYLSSAYAISASGIQGKENEIVMYTTQQSTVEQNITRLIDRSTQLQNSRAQQENRLDEFVRLGRGTATQQAVIREQDTEIKTIQTEVAQLSAIRDSLSMLKTTTTNSIATTGKLGTFYYVAQTLGVPLDVIVKWFIATLVLVFDPMSISLFIAYNVIVEKKRTVSEAVTPTVTLTSNSEVESDVAFITPIEDEIHPTGVTFIQTGEVIYYMMPGYDWANDTKWHDDPDARGFKGNLGY